jgi:hypothetical protein
VDTRTEADGFTRWVLDAEGKTIDPDEVEQLMASPSGAPPEDDVVEETVERLLTLAGLPLPDWPTDDDAPPG